MGLESGPGGGGELTKYVAVWTRPLGAGYEAVCLFHAGELLAFLIVWAEDSVCLRISDSFCSFSTYEDKSKWLSLISIYANISSNIFQCIYI